MDLQMINVTELNEKEIIDLQGGLLIGVGGLWDNSRFFSGFIKGFEDVYESIMH
ncbi:hypothetical protein U6A24_06285 [Aquimarina gracilis]|uniref:Bacteriocin-like protein n=1 Tax=Aquimarina gracilis TaxID=874422 RepID=A0ABU5ZSL1_9FLAO|nr:hypothetical protein [Aquimarina gracilis]MEB3345059.1 hypothetical protein [Aquimarina gracilis]